MSQTIDISVTVNHTTYERSVEPRMLLSDFLRHELCLTGTHVGCEHGVCGACTVIFDGQPCRSCLIFAVQADGHEILTMVPFLERNPHPTEEEIRQAISGNICRCTGYQNIVDAVMLAAEKMSAAQRV